MGFLGGNGCVGRVAGYIPGARLRSLALAHGGTVERWNGRTVERWNGGTVERWNARAAQSALSPRLVCSDPLHRFTASPLHRFTAPPLHRSTVQNASLTVANRLRGGTMKYSDSPLET